MEYTKANCSSCNRELHIKVPKGSPVPKTLCKACNKHQELVRMNFDALTKFRIFS